MPTHAARNRARAALVRLAGADMDIDMFRIEAAATLRDGFGFEGWCWPLLDPVAGLPTRYVGALSAIDSNGRKFCQLVGEPWRDGHRVTAAPSPPDGQGAGPGPAVTMLSTATGGDLQRDLLWREILGPAGIGDVIGVRLVADGTCWGLLHLARARSDGWFDEDEAALLAEVAPLLTARLRGALRTAGRPGDLWPEPGTVVVDRKLNLVAATEQAWRWIERLGIPPLNEDEPLPAFVYAAAARVANSPPQPPRPARVRLQAADGRWVVVQVAALTEGPGSAGAGSGYAVTLHGARSDDLAPLLMRAWALTNRERDVAQLVIDGLATEDIATTLFISPHTVRDHIKVIFDKIGIRRRRDMVAALAGAVPESSGGRDLDAG